MKLMRLALKVLNGPLISKFAPIKEGLSIGRRNANLRVPDPQMSQLHVIIEKNGAGQYLLKDQGSRNGIIVNGEAKKELLLTPGQKFQLGATEFEVGQLDEQEKTFVAVPPTPTEGSAEGIELEAHTWVDYFSDFCNENTKVKNRPRNFKAFPKILELHFLRGPLIRDSISLAYGPRVLGRYDLEFPLYSEGLPDDLISIDAKGDDLYLKTRYPKLVKLNDSSVMSKKISTGDILEFADHRVLLRVKNFDD